MINAGVFYKEFTPGLNKGVTLMNKYLLKFTFYMLFKTISRILVKQIQLLQPIYWQRCKKRLQPAQRLPLKKLELSLVQKKEHLAG